MTYRPEIDGLRAVAVLIVLIFHINPNWMPGGFIGVDIFFVLSGFLITSIVIKSLERDSFSYKTFYTRRIKRLMPLFFAVVIFTLTVGYFVLFPHDFQIFAGDVLGANLFLANVKSAMSTNYFGSDQPLLHFWSLAVEEQFYFIMPSLLLLIHKYFKKYLILILVLLLIGSLALSQYMSMVPKYAQFSYFLLPSRAWELLAGCLLAVIKPNIRDKIATVFSLLGLGLITIGAVVINEHSVFPGIITLLPVVGSLFIIQGRESGFGKILRTKPFVIIGLASYSIYMWHWPLIIFIKSIFKIQQFSIPQTILLSMAIIGIGYLSQKYIEDFFRFMRNVNYKKTVVYYFFISLVITSAFSFYVYANKGFPERYGVGVEYTTIATKKCSHFDVGCFITQRMDEENEVIMIGDSHANHFSNLFAQWFDDEKIALKLFATGGCNFYSEAIINTACEEVKTKAAKTIQKANTVIIAKRFDLVYSDENFLNDFYQYVTKITEMNKSVIFVKQVPKFQDSEFLEDWMVAKRYGFNFDYNTNPIDSLYDEGNKKIIGLFSNNKNVHILDFNTIIQVNGAYQKFDEDRMPIYYNSNHLTAHGAEWIYNRIKKNDKYNWVVNLIAKGEAQHSSS